MGTALHPPERWKLIEDLFHQCLEMSPESRAAFLAEHCGSDAELRTQVEALLASASKEFTVVQDRIMNAARDFVAAGTGSTVAAGKRIGHYEIISWLGAGGMGEVYLAHDTRLKRKVAIKVLKPSLVHDERGLRRFQQEALAASALNHPNILTIFEFGNDQGIHFIAAEYVEGDTLRQKLSQGPLEPVVAADIAAQIAKALVAAHASGIVHRDIKPDNIIIRRDNLVKVLDFGIAKLTENQSNLTSDGVTQGSSVSLSQPGIVIGSAKYMSPEQARGQSVDSRSDLFSLGVVLYQMIAGRPPFEGQTVSDVIGEVLTSTPPGLESFHLDTPRRIVQISNKAMCKDRDARYQSANDMLADLQEFVQEIQFRNKLEKVAHSPGVGHTTSKLLAALTPPSMGAGRPAKIAFAAIMALVLVLGVIYAGFVSRKPHTVATGIPPRSLAILPFRNLRQDPSLDYLGFSLADATITKLGYISTLIVRPSSSVDKYRNQTVDPQQVGRELSVDTLLTGGYLKDGDDLRITAQLVDIKSNRMLWRDSIDVRFDKLLTVQDRVTQEIVKGLELNLTPAEAQHLKPDNRVDPVAYEDYLRGVDLYSSNDFAAAIAILQKSASIDPNYAPTWAQLGRTYTSSASLKAGGREYYEHAEAAFAKALALNPELVEARIYMANMLTDTGHVEQAVPLLRTALQSSPNNPALHWELGYAYRFAGMLQESAAECEKARQNDPSVKINSSALNAYLYLGEYEKFLQTLPMKDSAYLLFYRGLAEYYLGRRDQAADHFDRAYSLDASLMPAQLGKALRESMADQHDSAVNLLRQIEDEMEARGVGDAEFTYKVTQAYAMLGQKPAALHMLRHTIEGGFFCYPCFLSDPLLASIRPDPEFQRLASEARARHEEFKAHFF
jgi:eukaryotic-like serine/threonine-protein kinase